MSFDLSNFNTMYEAKYLSVLFNYWTFLNSQLRVWPPDLPDLVNYSYVKAFLFKHTHTCTQTNTYFSGGSCRGDVDIVGGRGLPRRLRFENFVCQNERIWTLGGGAAPGTRPRSANVLVTQVMYAHTCTHTCTHVYRRKQFVQSPVIHHKN